MARETQPQGSPFTRRRVLGAAAAGTAAMASTALPPSIEKALASTPPGKQPSLRDIEHVVLIMLENRSFDHLFGTMSGVAGFSDPNALRLSTGRSVFHQPTSTNSDGFVLRFRINSRTTSGLVPGTDHSWAGEHGSWNGGRMDGWLTNSDGSPRNPFIMSYLDEQDIPFHRALAGAFTICDGYHASILSSTTPNRVMWETGTIDPEGKAGGPVLTNAMNVNTWRTYAENLTDAGVSWKHYWVQGGMASQTSYWKAFREAPTNSPLYLNAQKGVPGQFEYDALNDRLPTVSWLFPGPGQYEHPNFGINALPAAAEQFRASAIGAVAANPDVWAKTAFVISWDENDGLFDHVLPPVAPPGTPDESTSLISPGGIHGDGLPLGASFRVGCIIVSPWTAGGWVCSEPFDHTSQLRFLEAVTGVEASNISAWRRTTFGDLTSAFRFHGKPADPPVFADTSTNLTLTQYTAANLPAPVVPAAGQQIPPVQAPGRRPHTA